MSLRLINAGFATTVQDLGRWGFQSSGVPVGGAMDVDGLRQANLLVGNEIDEPCIEFLTGEAEIKFKEQILIALCGQGSRAFIDTNEIPFGKAILVRAGAILKFKSSPVGMWKYLAVGGGFHLSKILNSYSTYRPAGFGGLNGHWLQHGDTLMINQSKTNLTKAIMASLNIEGNNFCAANWGIPIIKHEDTSSIRVFEGPEWHWLTEQSQQIISKRTFAIGLDSNRMGYRLKGEELKRKQKGELISTAVTKGVVQLTNQGQLIVLMADGQTVGGYPRIAQVASVDIPKLAQKRFKESIQFKIVSISEAERLYLEREKYLHGIARSIKDKFSV